MCQSCLSNQKTTSMKKPCTPIKIGITFPIIDFKIKQYMNIILEAMVKAPMLFYKLD